MEGGGKDGGGGEAGRKERGGSREWRRWEGGRAGKGQEGGFSAEENGKARRQQSEAGEGVGWRMGALKEAKQKQEITKIAFFVKNKHEKDQ